MKSLGENLSNRTVDSFSDVVNDYIDTRNGKNRFKLVKLGFKVIIIGFKEVALELACSEKQGKKIKQ